MKLYILKAVGDYVYLTDGCLTGIRKNKLRIVRIENTRVSKRKYRYYVSDRRYPDLYPKNGVV